MKTLSQLPDFSDVERIVRGFSTLELAVFGDFYLDEYLLIDPSLDEQSLETGKTARQVVEVRSYPGAGGTVVNNLAAMGSGEIWAIGAIGNDGRAFDLCHRLDEIGVRCENLLRCDDRLTPTYTKPMVESGRQATELERLDIASRQPLPPDVENELLARLDALAGKVDGVVLLDQASAATPGLFSDQVRSAVADIAKRHAGTLFLADSRLRIGQFHGVMQKCNESEAIRAAETISQTGVTGATDAADFLFRTANKPVFITRGENGMLVKTDIQCIAVPSLPVEGPIDVTGAGDSATAAILLALCAGADPVLAAVIGNIAAAITISQLGITGVASQHDILHRYEQWLSKLDNRRFRVADPPNAS